MAVVEEEKIPPMFISSNFFEKSDLELKSASMEEYYTFKEGSEYSLALV